MSAIAIVGIGVFMIGHGMQGLAPSPWSAVVRIVGGCLVLLSLLV